MAGIYIHIPFCESRCIYCGFYSTTSLSLRETYVESLCHEMEMRPPSLTFNKGELINTIYLGGGTPSQLSVSQLQRIFDALYKNYGEAFPHAEKWDDMEITMECNPDDLTEEYCQQLRQLPINRISMGAQTFSDGRLQFLHRRHRSHQVVQAIERLRDININNISIDLMFGFPGETLQEWEDDITKALALHVEHLSAYSLMYEEGTRLYQLLHNKQVEEIDEEVSLEMYKTLMDKMALAGYEHYEISNFCLPGFHSRHNSSYWKEMPYIGLGAAAHSYQRKHLEKKEKDASQLTVARSWNTANLETYISSIRKGERPFESELLDLDTRYNDLITTALRTRDGINIQKLREEFGNNYAKNFVHEAAEKMNRGLMEREDEHIRLTRAGLYISDDIMSDFMQV